MIIVFDLGNSDLSFAAYEKDKILAAFRIDSDRKRSVDEYAYKIKHLLKLKGIDTKDVSGTILSSVVPSLTKVVKIAIERVLKEPLVVAPGIKTGLTIHTDNPIEVGADIVCVCVGAIKNYKAPIVVVDLGTATKIIAINKNKEFIGCSIVPGVKTSLESLVEIASQLPEVNLNPPQKVIGTNTSDSMNSGVIYGNASMVEGMVRRYEKEIGEKVTTIITGGLGSSISKVLEIEHILDKALIFEGLKIIYYKNKEKENEK